MWMGQDDCERDSERHVCDAGVSDLIELKGIAIYSVKSGVRV